MLRRLHGVYPSPIYIVKLCVYRYVASGSSKGLSVLVQMLPL